MNSRDILTNNNNTGSGVVFSISMMHRVVSGAEPGYILENLTAALGPAGGGSIFTGEDDWGASFLCMILHRPDILFILSRFYKDNNEMISNLKKNTSYIYKGDCIELQW